MFPLPKLPKKWPSKNKWRQLFKVLNRKERITLGIFLISATSSFIFLLINFYLQVTVIEPAPGGTYQEGVVGRPRFINPIYGEVSDVDRDLLELIFSGLMKYDEKGAIVPDLAKECKIEDGGRVFECYLKENIFWEDGKKITVDDIIYTVEIIQNPDYKSPLRASWFGVKIEKISDETIRFKLERPYPIFFENLTLKILPRHIWQDIPAQNFSLAIYNLKPIGSGPYKISDLKQDKLGYIKSLDLTRNPKYFGKTPNISKISFQFFENEEELIKAAQRGEVQGLTISDPQKYQLLLGKGFQKYRFLLPRYFAVFFNPNKSPVLAESNVRKALNYGTNKKEIIEKVLLGKGIVVDSPILPEIYGFKPPTKFYEPDSEKAKEILDKAGFNIVENGQRGKIIKKGAIFYFKSELRLGSRGKEVSELQRCLSQDPQIYPEGKITGFFDQETKEAVKRFQEKYAKEILEPRGFKKGTGQVGKNTRTKLNELCGKTLKETLPLSFSLVTVNQPLLVQVANLLKEQWQALGVEIKIKTIDIAQLEKEFIKTRNYESLLFGQVLGTFPDLFPFWHSSQKFDPGLNLALYQSKEADKLLEEIHQTVDLEIRTQKLEAFQEILIESAPVVFLYSPDYIYLVSKEIKGINGKLIVNPSKRFSGIENWYIKTKRVWR